MHLTALLELFAPDRPIPSVAPNDLDQLAETVGGTALARGLFRWHTPERASLWTRTAQEAFSRQAPFRCFAADWLGRQFALNPATEQVLLLDVGAGEALEIPTDLAVFHEQELVEFHDAALASTFYAEWRAATQDEDPLGPDECVGYSVPPFLGGPDAIKNLARTDADVYWSLTTQLLAQVS